MYEVVGKSLKQMWRYRR